VATTTTSIPAGPSGTSEPQGERGRRNDRKAVRRRLDPPQIAAVQDAADATRLLGHEHERRARSVDVSIRPQTPIPTPLAQIVANSC
jgi:hypothetical protein